MVTRDDTLLLLTCVVFFPKVFLKIHFMYVFNLVLFSYRAVNINVLTHAIKLKILTH